MPVRRRHARVSGERPAQEIVSNGEVAAVGRKAKPVATGQFFDREGQAGGGYGFVAQMLRPAEPQMDIGWSEGQHFGSTFDSTCLA